MRELETIMFEVENIRAWSPASTTITEAQFRLLRARWQEIHERSGFYRGEAGGSRGRPVRGPMASSA
jgi:hypothetical protein